MLVRLWLWYLSFITCAIQRHTTTPVSTARVMFCAETVAQEAKAVSRVTCHRSCCQWRRFRCCLLFASGENRSLVRIVLGQVGKGTRQAVYTPSSSFNGSVLPFFVNQVIVCGNLFVLVTFPFRSAVGGAFRYSLLCP